MKMQKIREIKVKLSLTENPNVRSLIMSMIDVIEEMEKEHNCDCTLFEIEVND